MIKYITQSQGCHVWIRIRTARIRSILRSSWIQIWENFLIRIRIRNISRSRSSDSNKRKKAFLGAEIDAESLSSEISSFDIRIRNSQIISWNGLNQTGYTSLPRQLYTDCLTCYQLLMHHTSFMFCNIKYEF